MCRGYHGKHVPKGSGAIPAFSGTIGRKMLFGGSKSASGPWLGSGTPRDPRTRKNARFLNLSPDAFIRLPCFLVHQVGAARTNNRVEVAYRMRISELRCLSFRYHFSINFVGATEKLDAYATTALDPPHKNLTKYFSECAQPSATTLTRFGGELSPPSRARLT